MNRAAGSAHGSCQCALDVQPGSLLFLVPCNLCPPLVASQHAILLCLQMRRRPRHPRMASSLARQQVRPAFDSSGLVFTHILPRFKLPTPLGWPGHPRLLVSMYVGLFMPLLVETAHCASRACSFAGNLVSFPVTLHLLLCAECLAFLSPCAGPARPPAGFDAGSAYGAYPEADSKGQPPWLPDAVVSWLRGGGEARADALKLALAGLLPVTSDVLRAPQFSLRCQTSAGACVGLPCGQELTAS